MRDTLNKHVKTIEMPSALTDHARQRMNMRRISSSAIVAVLRYGRVAIVRGAVIYAIGRKEVERFAVEGIDLAPHEGVQVVCSHDGAILTAYRNRDFRGLRFTRRYYRDVASEESCHAPGL